MQRREFITLLACTSAWPFAARAQQPEKMRRIGLLTPLAESDPEGQVRIGALRQALESLGWGKAATFESTITGRRKTPTVCGSTRRSW